MINKFIPFVSLPMGHIHHISPDIIAVISETVPFEGKRHFNLHTKNGTILATVGMEYEYTITEMARKAGMIKCMAVYDELNSNRKHYCDCWIDFNLIGSFVQKSGDAGKSVFDDENSIYLFVLEGSEQEGERIVLNVSIKNWGT